MIDLKELEGIIDLKKLERQFNEFVGNRIDKAIIALGLISVLISMKELMEELGYL